MIRHRFLTTTFLLLLPIIASGQTTVTIRQGLNGYSGVQDTMVQQGAATTNAGASTTMDVIGGTTAVKQALLKFENIIGSGANQIPANSQITSATLSLSVWKAGSGIAVHRMDAPWTEASTWTSLTNGIQIGDEEAHWSAVDTKTNLPIGLATFNVTETVQEWANGAEVNQGFALLPSDGSTTVVQIDTSESTFTKAWEIQPTLTVTYTAGGGGGGGGSPVISAVSPAAGATGVGANGQVALEVAVSDPNNDALNVTFYGREKTAGGTPGEDFTLVQIPDTQFYSENGSRGKITDFRNQTSWMVTNKDTLNIEFVAHMGDMVENRDDSEQEWINADSAMDIIENPTTTGFPHGIPWGGAPGNHDQNRSGGLNKFWNQYFGTTRWAGRTYFKGGYSDGTNDANYQFFSAGGMDFIVVNMEYRASAAMINWADALLKANPTRRAIITSHEIVQAHLDAGTPVDQAPFFGQGRAMYDGLKDNPNLFLMLCGHWHGEGRRSDTFEGRTVHSILCDYQTEVNGGDSWLRYLVFSPRNNTISSNVIRTRDGARRTGNDSQFTLNYNMSGGAVINADWTQLGTVAVPAAVTSATVNWTGLQAGKEYEWYAAASDGGTPVSTPPRSFTPGNNAAPTVALTAPANGATITRPATVDFAATASDSDGSIAKVEFYQGTVKVGEDASAPYAFSWDAPAATYSLTALAVDNGGGRATSAARTVTVTGSGGGGTPVAPTIALTYPALDSNTAGGSGRVALEASVFDGNNDAMNVTFYGRPKATGGGGGADFTLAVMPDTQHYTENNGQYINNWKAQSDYIVAKRATENMVYVAHVGDVTELFDQEQYEWVFADQVMKIIENPTTTLLQHGIPWGAVPGNHDLNTSGNRGSNDYYNQYFGPQRFAGRPYFGGGITATDNHCSHTLFSAGGMDFVVVNLRHRPTATMISWGDSILKQYPNRRAIVTCHEIISDSTGGFTGGGQAIFDGLSDNPNVFLMLCGHMHAADGENRRTDTVSGRTIHTVVQDYQDRAAGGGGWFRTYKFSPATSTISVKTVQAQTGTFETDADSQFTLAYPMTGGGGGGTPGPWVNLGTTAVPAGGTTARLDWTGLTAGTQYEWYAAVSDGGTPVSTTERTFTMSSNTAPTVALTAPANGSTITLPNTVNFAATASDTGGSVSRVEFFANGTLVGQDTTSPYAFNWSAPLGSHSLIAVAVDGNGARTTSSAVSVSVVGGASNTPPAVTLTGPANGSSVTLPATVNFTANASDSDGTVTKVEFYQGATKVGEDTTSPFAYNWAAPAGSYSLTAVAEDNAGARTTSPTVSVTVLSGGGGTPAAPTISLVYPAADSTTAGGSGRVSLEASVADGNNDPMNVTFYGRPKATGGGSGENFTLVTIPDTQYYSETTGNYPNFTNQMNWINSQKAALNIQFVSHMGDMIQNGDGATAEWQRASQAMAIIENATSAAMPHGMPWGGGTGNHDGGGSSWNQYFGPSRWAGRTYFKGGITASDATSNYEFFSASGMDFIVIHLKYNAGSTQINWADALLKANPTRRAIVTSHEIMRTGVQGSFSGAGSAIFNGLNDNPNLFLLLCGHIHGDGRRTDTVSGRNIETILTDYQSEANGGDSWLRYLTFVPAQDKVESYVIRTRDGSTRTGATQRYSFTYDMTSSGGGTPGPWVNLGTTAVPAGGTVARLDWTGLTSATQYEWYAAVSDGGTPVSTTERTFTMSSNTAPTVALTAPANGSTVTLPNTVNFSATASDTGGSVSRVEFFANGTLVGQDTTSPYAFNWSAPLGSHSLTAVAVDGNGARTTSSAVSVTVVTGNNAPTIALTSPANGAVIPLPGTVNFAATASDSDGSITRVEFFHGSTKVGEDTSTPYSFNWAAAPGSYSLTAVAEDNAGARTTTGAVTVTVTNAPPVVAVTAPANGQNFRVGDVVTINAAATDSDGSINRVQFYSGATLLGQRTIAPYTLTWTPPTGSFTLTAVAEDNFGATTTSSAVAINVSANSPPVISLLAPSNGDTIPLPNPVNFAATASDPDGSITKVEFHQNGVKVGEVASPPFTFTWAATPGSYSLTAVAQDNNNARTTSSAVNVTVTNQSPVITLNSPANGASFTLPDNVTITATASDTDSAITRVEFYAGNTLLHQDSVAPYGYAWNPPPGSHVVTAVAVDEHGAETTSAAAAITVVNPPPTVAITSPTNGATVNLPGPVSIAADATDADGSVAKVEFYVGATKLGEDTSAPFAWPWTPITGSYTLTCVAQDDRGARTSSAPVALAIDNPNNLPPAVAVANPSNGQTLPANTPVNISATTSDTDGIISKVEFFAGTNKISEDTSAPFTATWPGATAGSYSLTAVATDNDGGITTSALVTINLVDNIPPTVVLTAPTNTQNFSATTINLSATASDSDGTVAKVEFYRGTTKLGEDTTAPYVYSWTGGFTGAHVFTAVAVDDDGSRGTSLAARATISAPVTLTFQQGVNGYVGMEDTGLRGASAATNYASGTTISVDADDGGSASQALLEFGDIVGTAANQIPPGATITSASLTIQVMNQGSGFTVHRMIVPWTEAAATWNSLGSGVSANNVEAISTPITSAGANNSSSNVTTGALVLPITAAVQEWANGTGNNGVVLLPYSSGTDGVDFYTSEWSSSTQRPKLTVIFTAAPQETAPLIVNEALNGGESHVTAVGDWSANDAVELLLTQDISAAQLMGYTFGDSPDQTTQKSTAWRLSGLEAIAATFRAGTLITVRGPLHTEDLHYTPMATGTDDQWNLLLTPAGGHVTLLEGSAPGGFEIAPYNEVLWVDSAHTGLSDLAVTHGVAWDDPATHQVGAFTTTGSGLAIVHASVNPDQALAYTGGAGEFFNGTKFANTGSLNSLGLPNPQGTNSAYIATLRGSASGISPFVTITAPDALGAEFGSDKTLLFRVSRTGTTAASLSVALTASGTATPAVDFSGFSSPLLIPAGSAAQDLPLTVLRDSLCEGDETLRISLAAGAGYQLGSPASVQGTIKDNPSHRWIGERLPLGTPKSGINDDADGDGESNLMEYFKGSHPGDQGSRSNTEIVMAAQGPKFRFKRATDLTDVFGTVRWSRNLTSWKTSGESDGDLTVSFTYQTVSPPGQNPEEVEATAILSGPAAATAGQLFLRLEVQTVED